MKTGFAAIGFVVVALVVGTCVACGDDEDEVDSFGPIVLISHEYDDRGDYSGDQDYEDQWSNEDRNRNRNRNRGAFSPGPFDDSPVDAFNGNTICLPGSTCEQPRDDRQPPSEDGQP